jgi:hypothetical protein
VIVAIGGLPFTQIVNQSSLDISAGNRERRAACSWKEMIIATATLPYMPVEILSFQAKSEWTSKQERGAMEISAIPSRLTRAKVTRTRAS